MPLGLAWRHVRAARVALRQAIQTCGSADLAGLQRAVRLLETVAGEMQFAEAAVQSSSPGDPAGLRLETSQLKTEVAWALRVIDGCAALHRGLSIRLVGSTSGYTAQGHAVAASSAASCEMQG